MAARRERGLLDPDAARGREPRSTTHIWCIASDGDIEEGVSHEASLARRHQRLGNLVADLRRQPHLDRGRHRRSRCPRTSPPATRRTAGTCSGSTGSPATGSTHEDVAGARRRRSTPRRPSPTGRRSSRCAPIIGWPAPNKQNTGKAHGCALGADEVAATKKVLGFDPDQTFDVDDEVLAHAREVVDRGRAAHAEWDETFDAWAADNPDGKALLDRMSHPHAARRLDRRAAGVPGRRQGHRHPQGVRQGARRARAGAARAVGRLGRPGREQQHDDQGRAVLPARGPRSPRSSPATRTAGRCTSASASTPWARS